MKISINIAVNNKLIRNSNGGNVTTNANPLTRFKEIIDFYCENHMTDINVLRGKMPGFCDVAACSQFPLTQSYPEPDGRSPHHFTQFLYFILHKICLVVIFLLDFWIELCWHCSALSSLSENCYETHRYFLPFLGGSVFHVVGYPPRKFSRTVPHILLLCLRAQCFSFAVIFLLSKPLIEQRNYATCKQ